MNIEMDLITDWQEIMIEDVKKSGLTFSDDTPKNSLLIKYFTHLRKKGGEPRPRTVHKSNEFVCPAELRSGLKNLETAIRNGDDLSSYLSKKVDDISVIDGLFNDWGVIHLHLGVNPDPNDSNYIERTGPLLFLYLIGNDAYLINVFQHGDWTKVDILQTVYDNWPQLLDPYIFKGVEGVSQQFTEKQHSRLRNNGMSVIIELKDKNNDSVVLMPPGMGIAASKDPIIDVRNYQNQVSFIRNLEQSIHENQELFRKTFDGNIPDTMRMKLVYQTEEWIICEESTGEFFKISDLEN